MDSVTCNSLGMLVFGGISALWAQIAHALGSSDEAAMSLGAQIGLLAGADVEWWS